MGSIVGVGGAVGAIVGESVGDGAAVGGSVLVGVGAAGKPGVLPGVQEATPSRKITRKRNTRCLLFCGNSIMVRKDGVHIAHIGDEIADKTNDDHQETAKHQDERHPGSGSSSHQAAKQLA